LGNGGLGRLAACFLDSLATLRLPGNGNTIRYQYGLFKQLIVNNEQVEVPDQWLRNGNGWETRHPDEAVKVKFYGHVKVTMNYETMRRKFWLFLMICLSSELIPIAPIFCGCGRPKRRTIYRLIRTLSNI